MFRIALSILLFLPSIALAAPRTFSELAENSIQIINGGIGVTIILGLVIYFYGIASGIGKLRGGGIEELRPRIVWGLVAIFVMVSVWGIVGLVRNTLFGGGGGVGNLDGSSSLQESNCQGTACWE